MSPSEREQRPRAEGAGLENLAGSDGVQERTSLERQSAAESDLAEYLAGLRRRREAARRLPPLEHSGARDPWVPEWCP